MSKKQLPIVTVHLDKIVGGGQTLGKLEDGKKVFVWGGLPGETVEVQLTKKKPNLAEGVVIHVISPSKERVAPRDESSYLSTSPWQIMDFTSEQHYKAALIEEAFELHDIVLPNPIDVYTDGNEYQYRNKLEFSWYWDKQKEQLDIAFFRRGSHGKIQVESSSLAHPNINLAATTLRDILRKKADIQAFMLKTLLVRTDAQGNVAMQLYVKDEPFIEMTPEEFNILKSTHVIGIEVIYSNPKSPASVITKRLQSMGETTLSDTLLDIQFDYAVEGFFQINLPVYEQALRDMKEWVIDEKPTIDLYSGVGTIGLTIGGNDITLVEINEHAVREMKRNINKLGRGQQAQAILAPSEKALDYITHEKTIIVDPPRAGLHEDLIDTLLEEKPDRIIYLSCNPVTQARDVARLASTYGIRHHQGYNFFPRTPHIEHLVILDKKP